MLCAYAGWLREQRTSPRVAGCPEIGFGGWAGQQSSGRLVEREMIFVDMAARYAHNVNA